MTVETLQTPYLLLASPELNDPNFNQTVVLMGHHTEQGALGWIINRLVEGGAASLLPEDSAKLVNPATPLFLGGPVWTPGLLVIHRQPIPGVDSALLANGLYVCSSAESLPVLFSSDPGEGRPSGLLIFGYSGWGPGQLEREMSESAWLVLPYDESLAFSMDPGTLWEESLRRLGVAQVRISAPASGVN